MAQKRKFRDDWLQEAAFRPWLARFDGDLTRAYGQICKRDVAANKTAKTRPKDIQLHVAKAAARCNRRNKPVHSTPKGVAFATIVFCCFMYFRRPIA